jgi:hypothetical protein
MGDQKFIILSFSMLWKERKAIELSTPMHTRPTWWVMACSQIHLEDLCPKWGYYKADDQDQFITTFSIHT